MGVFDHKPGGPEAPASSPLTPVTQPRILKLLDKKLNATAGVEDCVIVYLGEHPIVFRFADGMLVAELLFAQLFGPSRLMMVRELLNQWNLRRVSPQAFWAVDDSGGRLQAATRVVHHFGPGATDTQLKSHLSGVIAGNQDFVMELDEVMRG